MGAHSSLFGQRRTRWAASLGAVVLLAGTALASPAVGYPSQADTQPAGSNVQATASSYAWPADERSIAVGALFTCATTSTGAVNCWGDNTHGQLGNGSRTNSTTPKAVVGLGSRVLALSSGQGHTCALTAAGAVKCWGENAVGQLGDGTRREATRPVQVRGLTSGVTSISAGYNTTCARLASGALRCWGLNYFGQIGDGTRVDRLTPTYATGLRSGVAQVDVGGSHTCIRTTAGAVKCWGVNLDRQLGDGTHANSLVPRQVVGLTRGVAEITAGVSHTCARTTAGAVMCWGDNQDGQVGDGTRRDAPTPVTVIGLGRGMAAVAAGGMATCARSRAGAMTCWGRGSDGQLGIGTRASAYRPRPVTGLARGVAGMGSGPMHTCARTGLDTLWCWGSNGVGEVGDGTITDRLVPTRVLLR